MTIDDSGWKIDRRIPIAVIMAFVLQIAGVLIWAAELNARVNSMEQLSISNSGMNEKFARLEERLDSMKQNIESMKRQMDRLTERLIRK